MASELNMYESHVSEYRMDIDRLQREMQEIKKKYFLQKKRSNHECTSVQYHTSISMVLRNIIQCRRNQQALVLPDIATKRAELPSFKGGGFNFKQTQKAMA